MRRFRVATEQPYRGPGGHQECHHQREDHGRGCADRDRPHVRPHEAAHESHRQDRRNDGESRQDGGIADLGDRFDCHIAERSLPVLRQAVMTNDVLHHHDGVVDEDADRKDQRKQCDPIEGVSDQIEDGQSQRQRDGNGNGHDPRLAPAKRERDKQGHGDHSQQHVEKQLVRFLLRCLAIVTGDGQLHIGRNDGALQRFEFLDDRARDSRRVCGLPFRHRDGHRRRDPRLGAGVDIVRRLLRPVGDGGNVSEVDRAAVARTEDDPLRVVCVADEPAGLDEHLLVVRGEGAGRQLSVRLLDHPDDRRGRQTVRSDTRRIDGDAKLAPQAADDLHRRNIVDLLDLRLKLRRHTPEREVVIAIAGERQRQNRHIVDRPRLDQRTADTRGNRVGICLELLIETDDGPLLILSDFEAHHHHGHAGRRGRVNVFDSGDFPEELLHRLGDALLDLMCRHPRHLHVDVDHGDDDLRLLLAREQRHGADADEQRCRDEQRRELGLDEDRRQAAGNALRLAHERPPAAPRRTTTLTPSRISFVTCGRIVSPGSMPESTSTRCPCGSPSVTRRM